MIAGTDLLYFRLAYLFRRPIFEIRRWPASEILAWKTFFRQYGPLDWERDDIRDARQVWLAFGKRESTIEDCLLFRPPKPVSAKERAIQNLENMRAAALADGDTESAENCQREIRRIGRESF